ncbi:thermonuclease family protein [Bacillus sp. 37MA]|uniref:thermonuclease family protein n=1 Tax=Bacillus sp. 37MA TaxID=1132442 RepID=UPI0003621C24|nr:thermonuclease family protein [Bacillus sp. 37MA]
MKFIKWGLIALVALFFLSLIINAPLTLIGLAVLAYGIYELRNKRHGRNKVSKPGWVVAAGIFLLLILPSFSDSKNVNEVTQEQQKKQEELDEKEKALEEREKELAAKEKELEDTLQQEEQVAKEVAAPATTAVVNKEQAASSLPDGLIAVTVNRVVDGDMLKVTIDGKEETVRLILVDTPETKHPQKGVQPFGPEASAFTTEQLSGVEVKIEPGIEERDRYGRLLAYVYVGEKMFNKMLLEKGLARVAVYPPNTQYLDEFEKIQADAKSKAIGIWSIENYATDDGYNSESNKEPETIPAPVQEEPEPIPVAEPQPAPDPEPVAQYESYQNCTELRKVYPAGVASDHPAYESKHDRDKDNWACEN